MRAGWTPKFRELLHRADPALHLIAEVVQVRTSDVKDTKNEWNAADDTSGCQVLDSGGLMLYRNTSAVITQAADNGTASTGLSRALPARALLVEWTGANAERQEVFNLVARLHPRADGGLPKDVIEWRAAIYRVLELGPDEGRIMVAPMASAEVEVVGETASNVTFNFTLNEHASKVGPPPKVPSGALANHPQTLIRVWAVTSTGAAASNVAWMADSTIGATLIGEGYVVTHYNLLDGETSQGREEGGGTVFLLDSPVACMPRFTLARASYSAATVGFTQNVNRIQDHGLHGVQEEVAP